MSSTGGRFVRNSLDAVVMQRDVHRLLTANLIIARIGKVDAGGQGKHGSPPFPGDTRLLRILTAPSPLGAHSMCHENTYREVNS